MLEEQHENFVAAVGKKGTRKRTTVSSIKRVTKKILEVSRCKRAKRRQRNVQKSVLQEVSAKLLFC